MKQLEYPLDLDFILRKQKSLRKQLMSSDSGRIKKRIAVLGGSTTAAFIDALELFLLDSGIEPLIYESAYNQYFEEGVFPNKKLDEFSPDIIIIYTSVLNLLHMPNASDTLASVEEKIAIEYARYEQLWNVLFEKYHCIIIQNNFDMSVSRPMGNGEMTDYRGIIRYINKLNVMFATYGDTHNGFYVHDINYLSVKYGMEIWHRRAQYYAYKSAFSTKIIPYIAFSITKIIRSIWGIVKKCLVLDLDNTLWGGVIGDDGVEGIILGNETPLGEAYGEFQQYLLKLKSRGILLAVCSKNDEQVAMLGFTHPDSILKVNDFVAFKANWNDKNINIKKIAQELGIGLDSFVFIDDNPVERELVRTSLPMVSVPEVDPNDVFSYIHVLEENGYFEQTTISPDDLKRNANYADKRKIQAMENAFDSYKDFLLSLSMKAEIKPFQSIYYNRISQLTNKSNQYNLTTKRCTIADIERYANDENVVTLYARLEDKFGDCGLVSVVVGTVDGMVLNIDLWLMSCRVLKRNLEMAVFDELVVQCQKRNLLHIKGYYYPTEKNGMVAAHYKQLGFELLEQTEKKTVWVYDIVQNNAPLNDVIRVYNT